MAANDGERKAVRSSASAFRLELAAAIESRGAIQWLSEGGRLLDEALPPGPGAPGKQRAARRPL